MAERRATGRRAGTLTAPRAACGGRANKIDEAVRRLPRLESPAFLRRARVPLAELDPRSPQERGELFIPDRKCAGRCET